jgi:hypothetical protein
VADALAQEANGAASPDYGAMDDKTAAFLTRAKVIQILTAPVTTYIVEDWPNV